MRDWARRVHRRHLVSGPTTPRSHRPSLRSFSLQALVVLALGLSSAAGCASESDGEETASDQDLAGSTVAKPGKYAAGKIVELGGTNLTLSDGWQRPVIPTYHLNPTRVAAQMKQLYKSGQKKIVFFLWYMPIGGVTPPGGEPHTGNGYIADSAGGALCPQHQENLRAMARLAKSIGFTEVTLRFGQQGGADPSSKNAPWQSGWSEAGYLENRSFIFHTRAILESELASSSVKRWYDLGVELGGITENQNTMYTRRLWSDYHNRFGKEDSYGFSVAVWRGRVAEMIRNYDASGGRPNRYAIDTYGEGQGDPVDVALGYTYDEMNKAGDGKKPLVIQETYADNAEVAKRIVSALNRWPITLQSINQWPQRTMKESVLTPLPQYKAYGGSSASSGTIVAGPCVLAPGQTVCESQVSWETSYASNVAVYVNDKLMAALPSGSVAAPWIGGPARFELRSNEGVLATTTITALPAGTPTLDAESPKLTCDAFQCVAATGSNIAPGCQVSLFTPDWSVATPGAPNPALLATVPASSCEPNAVRFEVPAAILSKYKSINFNVSNPNGKWSEPVMASIDRPAPSISQAGLGCDKNQCIWANGANIAKGCSVAIFTPDWSAAAGAAPGAANPALLATVTSVECDRAGVSLEIPAWILSKYRAVNFNVNNPYGKWSEPRYLKIAP